MKPASGIVEPGGSVDLLVTRIAQRELPSQGSLRDLFLVQALLVGAALAPDDVTGALFQAHTAAVKSTKLKVSLVLGDSSANSGNKGTEVGQQVTSAASLLPEPQWAASHALAVAASAPSPTELATAALNPGNVSSCFSKALQSAIARKQRQALTAGASGASGSSAEKRPCQQQQQQQERADTAPAAAAASQPALSPDQQPDAAMASHRLQQQLQQQQQQQQQPSEPPSGRNKRVSAFLDGSSSRDAQLGLAAQPKGTCERQMVETAAAITKKRQRLSAACDSDSDFEPDEAEEELLERREQRWWKQQDCRTLAESDSNSDVEIVDPPNTSKRQRMTPTTAAAAGAGSSADAASGGAPAGARRRRQEPAIDTSDGGNWGKAAPAVDARYASEEPPASDPPAEQPSPLLTKAAARRQQPHTAPECLPLLLTLRDGESGRDLLQARVTARTRERAG